MTDVALDADRQGPSGRIKSRNEARAESRERRRRFGQAHRAEMRFRRQLKMVARQVGTIVRTFAPKGHVEDATKLTQMMRRYADMLQPWAALVAKQMVEEVAARDAWAWQSTGKEIGRELRSEIERAPTGEVMKRKMAEAERLITSLPLEAAQRVHGLVIEGMSGGVRAKETAKEIMRTEEVTASRAELIARTETTRSATALVEARARFVGATHYVWETVGDADVREIHRKLQGKVISWDEPPIAGENGERAHAGAIYNCRCWPRPIIPEAV